MFSQILARFQSQKKQDGAILLITVILSGIMITIGLGVSTLLIKEIKITTNFYFSEKAYYAAESGVEEAVLALNEEMVNNVENHEVLADVDGAKSTLNIKNIVTKDTIQLPPKANVKLRLRKDDNPNITNDLSAVNLDDLELKFSNTENVILQLKIVCTDTSGSTNQTVSYQKLVNNSNIDTISSIPLKSIFDGNYEDYDISTDKITNYNNRTVAEFLNNLEIIDDHKTCVLSLNNLGEHHPEFNTNPDKVFTVELYDTEFPPYQATIKSTGELGGRKKIISFKHKQNAIPTMISEFGLFHCESDGCFGNE